VAKDLHVRAGVRWDYVSEFMRRDDVAPALGVDSHFGRSGNFPMPSAKAGIDYMVIDHTMAYANIGFAYKPGGYSAFTNTPSNAGFKNEKTLFAELGAKSVLWEGRVHANASVFYYDIRDYQLERSIPNSLDYIVLNAERASSIGAEADVRVSVLPQLDVFGGIGATRTVLDKYDDPFTGADLDGTIAPYVPRYTGTIGVAAAKLPAGLFAHVEWVATGVTHYSDLDFAVHTDNYAILNGGFGVAGDNFRISAFATNLNNRFYYSTLQPSIGAGAVAIPRQLGVSAEVRF
ncbi:MAG: TonB-dependent receptor, partial [Planctomycetaceae bacterium]|nr:TonB-dependent receptor [Planctomycetaceae bacterium]